MSTPHKHISLYDLLAYIKNKLSEAVPAPVWVVAEVSELKVNYSGHCYMELIEKGTSDKLPRAKCNAVVWRNNWGMLSAHFQSATGQQLAPGVKILFRAVVNFHEAYGFSLVINDIDPSYTLGEMERQRRETIARLEQEGVFEMNRTVDMPAVVQRVAVVSSKNAAGFQDFYQELESSPYRFDLTLFDAYMQGAETENSVVEALERIADQCDDFDVVVIIRGGGSQSDLAAFDSYRLCAHVAQFPLPVITGIGHDKDQSVADLVAAVALKTPTAVARWLIDGMERTDAFLAQTMQQVTTLARDYLSRQGELLQRRALMLRQFSSTLTRELELRLERYSVELRRRPEMIFEARRARLETYENLLRQRTSTLLAAQRSRLDVAGATVAGQDPARILSLGFSLVRSGGKVVRNAADLTPGDNIVVTMSKGSVEARVEQINK